MEKEKMTENQKRNNEIESLLFYKEMVNGYFKSYGELEEIEEELKQVNEELKKLKSR